ncbi:SIMPL domain-containing protein [Pseudaestuariivita sp.]|uniref:SIMPL domain-containing protein n=1 Tax=Pseudaestuariivita sp. TaxID=2211669 RepID=UPI004059B9B3
MAVFGLWVANTAAAEDVPQIAVTGQGQVTAVPDMATVSVSVVHTDAAAQEAMRKTSESARAMLERVAAFGLEPRDVQTGSVQLNPEWSRYDDNGNRRKITGYTARNQLTLRVRDLENLGPLLDALLTDGANEFGGLTFGVQDPQPLEDAARQAAVREAMRTAGLLTDTAGLTLGEVLSMSLGGGGFAAPKMARMEMASDAGVPVAAGELTFTATVSMVFAIAP